MMPKTMRLRLIAAFALVVVIAIGSMVLITRQVTAQQVRIFMFRGGMTGTEGLVEALEDYYAVHSSWQGVETIFNSANGTPSRGRGSGQGSGQGSGGMSTGMMQSQGLLLADGDGRVVYDNRNEYLGIELSSTEKSAAVDLQSAGSTVGYLLTDGGMAFSSDAEAALLERLNQAAVTAALIAGGAALLLALILAYTLLRPIGELRTAAANLAAGDLSQRVPVRGDDEIARLAGTFNFMATSLQEAQEGRQALTADIAHELRTPLAVQRAHLEAIQDGIYDLKLENLTPIEEQNRLLTRLVDDLRILALADSGQLSLERTPTDLPALVQRVATRFIPQMDAQQVQLSLAPQPFPDIPLLSLDAQRIEQILHNLLSNALRYTPPGGRIRCSLVISGGEAQLQVHDSGPGVPADALEHIFERFYRADKARDRQGGGTGLGLSIARKLALAHNADLKAANHPDGGAVFTLVLPMVSTSLRQAR